MTRRRKKAISDPDTCVCGRERENLEERKLLHCRACSRASSAAHRARHGTRLAAKDRARRRLTRELLLRVGEEAVPLREARDATLIRVWLHRGLIHRDSCVCGGKGRPIIVDRENRHVLWQCDVCTSNAPRIRRDSVVWAVVDEQPMHVASTELVLERTTILSAIDALPQPERDAVLERVRMRRPGSIPPMLWRQSSVMWKDVAIAVYREVCGEGPPR
jgi:hypothetical protein